MKQRSKRRDAQAISHHYDVSNDFYALFLDPLMLYTCAYYREPDGKLEQGAGRQGGPRLSQAPAQAGRDAPRRRLRLGWSLHLGGPALRRDRARVTLSRAQADWASARIKREGLEGRCLVEYRDHRDLPPDARYDKIAAIGVIEHVGVPNYPAFFGRVREMLNDGGLYLNHGIHHDFHWKRTSQTDFLYEHVFPNGDLSGVSETMTEMERAGWEVSTSRTSACTTRAPAASGSSACQARAEEARTIVGERTYRTWLLYLACSSMAFSGGSIGLYQFLLRKQWDRVGWTEPATREDLYA